MRDWHAMRQLSHGLPKRAGQALTAGWSRGATAACTEGAQETAQTGQGDQNIKTLVLWPV